MYVDAIFFLSSRRRHTRWPRDWSSDVCSSDLVAGVEIQAIHTPGHSPGSTCYYVTELGLLLSGDTLFQGGPGATGRSFSSRETIEDSIRERLFVLPDETVVHTEIGRASCREGVNVER